jgi:hypothetical protein
MSRKNPLVVKFNKLGYILELDDNRKYVLHPIEFTICGKLIEINKIEKIMPLNEIENQNILMKGLRYQYNSKPANYWDNIIYDKEKNPVEMSLKELINETKKRDPVIIRRYINKCIVSGRFGDAKSILVNKAKINLNRDDYMNILNSSERITSYYPLISDERYTANNFNHWIYYSDYQCWINKNGERCSCICCYHLRDSDEYSILNFNNNHCVFCNCSDCVCENTKQYNIKDYNENSEINICDSHSSQCYMCKSG